VGGVTHQIPPAYVLGPLRQSIALLRAQAEISGQTEAASHLDDALAAIGPPAVFPHSPVSDGGFPAGLFHEAIALLEQAAGFHAVDRGSLIDCWTELRAARRSWTAA
jgi:hypothetical protein